MTDNEKLIEEAAEAMLDAARELLGVETIGERPREMTREYARRAFAVFEKAHTPTDADWYDTHCPTCDAPEPWHTATCAVVHVKVPEPQGEPSDAQLAEIEQRVYDQHRGQIAGMAKALVRAGWDAAVEGQR